MLSCVKSSGSLTGGDFFPGLRPRFRDMAADSGGLPFVGGPVGVGAVTGVDSTGFGGTLRCCDMEGSAMGAWGDWAVSLGKTGSS